MATPSETPEPARAWPTQPMPACRAAGGLPDVGEGGLPTTGPPDGALRQHADADIPVSLGRKRSAGRTPACLRGVGGTSCRSSLSGVGVLGLDGDACKLDTDEVDLLAGRGPDVGAASLSQVLLSLSATPAKRDPDLALGQDGRVKVVASGSTTPGSPTPTPSPPAATSRSEAPLRSACGHRALVHHRPPTTDPSDALTMAAVPTTRRPRSTVQPPTPLAGAPRPQPGRVPR